MAKQMDSQNIIIILFIAYILNEKFNMEKLKEFLTTLRKKVVNLTTLNEESLSKQPLFWLGVSVPIILSCYIEYRIIITENIKLEISNINRIFEISKIPMYISALTPTLGIFISNIHRTIQIKKQIDSSAHQINISSNQYNAALEQLSIAQKKSTSDSYYSHYKYISDEFKNIQLIEFSDSNISLLKNKKIMVKRPHALYKKIFPDSSIVNGCNPVISTKFIDKISILLSGSAEKITKNRMEILNDFKNKNEENIKKTISHIDDNLSEILKLLYSSCNTIRLIDLSYSETTPRDSTSEHMDILRTFFEMAWAVRQVNDLVVSVFDIINLQLNDNEDLSKSLSLFQNTIDMFAEIYSDFKNDI